MQAGPAKPVLQAQVPSGLQMPFPVQVVEARQNVQVG